MTIWTTALAAALAASGVALGGRLSRRLPRGDVVAPTFAAGLLLALVVLDIVPDAIRDGRKLGLASSAVPAVAVAVALVVAATLRRRGACCSTGTGRYVGAALALHAGLEGLVLGLGLGVQSLAAPVLLLAFWLHKVGEGVALQVSLRSRTPSARGRWIAIAICAPVVGAGLGAVVSVPERAVPLVLAGLGGMLLAVTLAVLRPALERSQARGAVAAMGAGMLLMGLVTGLTGSS